MTYTSESDWRIRSGSDVTSDTPRPSSVPMNLERELGRELVEDRAVQVEPRSRRSAVISHPQDFRCLAGPDMAVEGSGHMRH